MKIEKPVKPNNYIAAIKKILKMDTTDEEKETAEMVDLQNNLKNIIDNADPDTLKKLKELMNKKKQ